MWYSFEATTSHCFTVYCFFFLHMFLIRKAKPNGSISNA